MSPTDHKVGVLVPNAPPGASCAWTFENGEDLAQAVTVPCTEEVRLRVRYGRPIVATADIPLPDGSIRRATAEILVRDLLIAGLGNSIASGEGNPDRQIALTDDGLLLPPLPRHLAQRVLPSGPRRLSRQSARATAARAAGRSPT